MTTETTTQSADFFHQDSIIAFSFLFNEEPEFLTSLVWNVRYFVGPRHVIFINIAPRNFAKYERVAAENETVADAHVFEGRVDRRKWGSTLLAGHLETLGRISSVAAQVTHFCPMASNSLFFRPLDLVGINRGLISIRQGQSNLRGDPPADKHIVAGSSEVDITADAWRWPTSVSDCAVPVHVDKMPDIWHWPSVRREKELVNALKRIGLTDLYARQIEGLLARREDWERVAKRVEPVLGLGRECAAPLEEVLPFSVLAQEGSRRITSICNNFWARADPNPFGFYEGRVRTSDLLEDKWQGTPISAFKWFARDRSNFVTRLVSSRVGVQAVAKHRSAKRHGDPADAFEPGLFDSLYAASEPSGACTWQQTLGRAKTLTVRKVELLSGSRMPYFTTLSPAMRVEHADNGRSLGLRGIFLTVSHCGRGDLIVQSKITICAVKKLSFRSLPKLWCGLPRGGSLLIAVSGGQKYRASRSSDLQFAWRGKVHAALWCPSLVLEQADTTYVLLSNRTVAPEVESVGLPLAVGSHMILRITLLREDIEQAIVSRQLERLASDRKDEG